jgi:hypothetical protein
VRFLRRILRYTLALALVLVPTAQANRNVIYGVNDVSFDSYWATMGPAIVGLGIDQIGVWVRWHCDRDAAPSWIDSLSDNLDAIPPTQAAMVQLIGHPACTPHTRLERQRYARAARDVVRSHPNVRELQVWNEPELWFWRGTIREYTLLLAAVHDALRGTGVKVLGPGFSPSGTLAWSSFNYASFAADVRDYYRASGRRRQILDGFAYHPYWGYERKPTRQIAKVLNAWWEDIPQCPPARGLRFWWTETGKEGTTPGVIQSRSSYWSSVHMIGTPEQQAQRVAYIAWRARTDPLIVADFNFQLVDDRDPDRWQSGLYYIDGEPKPAFYAFQAAIRH